MLGGGVSNLVVKVETSKGTWVVKQALGKLRVKDEWVADPTRVSREVACLEVLRQRVGKEIAPAVVLEDRENFACVLECAPEGTRTWKQDLLANQVDSRITEKIANILIKFHNEPSGDQSLKKEFGDRTNFVQLRIDPYMSTVASRHQDLKSEIDSVSLSLLDTQVSLVHGDFSPKNMLLLSDGRIWIIDCEVAHYGNPAFDISFCVNHLMLKSIHLRSKQHLEESSRLWELYWEGASDTLKHVQRDAVRTLSVLLLARVDGKSPVEYLSEENKMKVRSIARKLVLSKTEDFGEVYDAVLGSVG